MLPQGGGGVEPGAGLLGVAASGVPPKPHHRQEVEVGAQHGAGVPTWNVGDDVYIRSMALFGVVVGEENGKYLVDPAEDDEGHQDLTHNETSVPESGFVFRDHRVAGLVDYYPPPPLRWGALGEALQVSAGAPTRDRMQDRTTVRSLWRPCLAACAVGWRKL